MVRGSLFRARDGARTTLFLVTPEGILLTDPLNVEFARWLKSELDTRFPGQPVRYVVYSASTQRRTGPPVTPILHPSIATSVS